MVLRNLITNKTMGTISFVLLNIFAAPLTFVILYALFSWSGLVIDFLLFIISYKVWKIATGNKDAKLSFCPKITFGGSNGTRP
jgi:hypothetical protein